MARLFAYVALLFTGGALVATAVTGTLWPVICTAAALYFLVKVYAACDEAPPPPTRGPRPPVYRGRTDRRMPS